MCAELLACGPKQRHEHERDQGNADQNVKPWPSLTVTAFQSPRPMTLPLREPPAR